jgi:signal transduction histidine kinase
MPAPPAAPAAAALPAEVLRSERLRMHGNALLPAHADHVIVFVHATGPGLGADEQQRLFQAFERLDADRRRIEGTGIGLALSRHLMRSMGGENGVDSAPGEGSRFRIRLPRTPEAAAPDRESAAAPQPDDAPHPAPGHVRPAAKRASRPT